MNTVLIFSDCTGRREYVITERYPPTLEYWRIIQEKLYCHGYNLQGHRPQTNKNTIQCGLDSQTSSSVEHRDEQNNITLSHASPTTLEPGPGDLRPEPASCQHTSQKQEAVSYCFDPKYAI